MIRIALPHPDDIIHHWDEIEPFVQLAVNESNGELTTGIIKGKIELRELALATVYDEDELIAVVSFDIIDFDSGLKVLNIQCAGGSQLHDWMERIDSIANDLAKQHDCTKVYVIGRAGWTRKLKHIGYSIAHTVLSREVV